MAIWNDDNGNSVMDGCEMCGKCTTSYYYSGIGFPCDDCIHEEEKMNGRPAEKDNWEPHPGNVQKIEPSD